MFSICVTPTPTISVCADVTFDENEMEFIYAGVLPVPLQSRAHIHIVYNTTPPSCSWGNKFHIPICNTSNFSLFLCSAPPRRQTGSLSTTILPRVLGMYAGPNLQIWGPGDHLPLSLILISTPYLNIYVVFKLIVFKNPKYP